MSNVRATRLGLVLGGVLLLALSGLFHRPLVERRKELSPDVILPEEAHPLVSITTVAFGGFRGLVADALWIRASKMMERGQYFELVQLAKWITQLQPRTPEVWAFNAYNLAYNVSALFPDGEDRWRWVRHGISMVRDEGLVYNPRSPALYWELGWYFQHKMVFRGDSKRQTYIDNWARIVDEAIIREDGLVSAGTTFEDLRMDLEHMRDLEAQYGPINWRVPHAHSLYWASKGLPYAEDFDVIRLRRMVANSMLSLMIGGIELPPGPEAVNPGRTITRPQIHLIPKLRVLYEQMVEDRPNVSSYKRALDNFLQHSIILLFTHGEIDEARSLFTRRNKLPETDPDSDPYFDRLIMILIDMHDPGNFTKERLDAYLVGLHSYAQRQALRGNRERARFYEELSTSVRTRWNEVNAAKKSLPLMMLPPSTH